MTTTQVNIPKSIIDPFYRYKRKRLTINVTNKNIVLGDIYDIANEINEIVQYIKDKISRPIKVSKNQVTIQNLKRSIMYRDLDDIIEDFIINYVICNACQNPETTYDQIDGKVMMKCKSCGSVNNIPFSKHIDKLRRTAKTTAKTTAKHHFHNYPI